MSSSSLRRLDPQPVSFSYLLKLYHSWLHSIHFVCIGLIVLAEHVLPVRGLRSKFMGNGALCRKGFNIFGNSKCSLALLSCEELWPDVNWYGLQHRGVQPQNAPYLDGFTRSGLQSRMLLFLLVSWAFQRTSQVSAFTGHYWSNAQTH